MGWLAPKKVLELCLFMRLSNYYRWFICSYSRKIAVLIDLKKDKAWVWRAEYQNAFDKLKMTLASSVASTMF